MMTSDSKVRSEHLARKAIVYLRQSSPTQVRENQESQRLQYALVERAHALGWKNVEVIDTDLGKSAGFAARKRPGFEKVISKVALDEVGIVLSREASRLSRTDQDWCRLLEVCQIFNTLIGDEDRIYDLDQMDDQLVLGIKGTLSVVELKVLKMRMEAGRMASVRRGEYRMRLPSGYVYDADGHPMIDPDLRVQEAIRLLFTKFSELGNVRRVHQWIADEELEFPVRRWMGGKLKKGWYVPQEQWVRHVLKNPFYAGAYVYGRRPTEMVVVDGKVVKRRASQRPVEEAKVFLPDHHEAYINWDTFKENQRIMADNRPSTESNGDSRTAARDGAALLVGLLRCSRCGRKFHVHYWGGRETKPRYMCSGEYPSGGDRCVAFSGLGVERAVVDQVLSVVSPMGVEASLLAIDRLKREDDERVLALRRRLEQLEYEATRAREQYDEVDPRNRLVAAELERRWNAKLEECVHARADLARREPTHREIDEASISKIREIGTRFEEVWDDCPAVLKKRIIRTVVEEIVVTRDQNNISLVLHWAGGAHTETVVHQKGRDHRRTPEEALDAIRALAPKYDDVCIASILNRNGMCTGAGKRWTPVRVQTVRRNYSIEGNGSLPPGVMSAKQAADRYGVTDYVIRRLISAGLVRNDQTVPLAPFELHEDDFESPQVQSLIQRYRKTGRLDLKGEPTKTQAQLFK